MKNCSILAEAPLEMQGRSNQKSTIREEHGVNCDGDAGNFARNKTAGLKSSSRNGGKLSGNKSTLVGLRRFPGLFCNKRSI